MSYYTKDDFTDELDLDERFDQLPSDDTIAETVANIEQRNIDVTVFESSFEAYEYLKSCVPKGADVMNGALDDA